MSKKTLQAIASRFREERLLVGFSQKALSDLTGKSRQQIINYETGRCEMTAGFLASLHDLAFDVQYIVTGIRSVNFYEYDETELI
ncbi:MAG: helix-turn-helix transcriptional regulator [Moraxella sp.]|nr:helix-turn-helix transcriptional regulator [Moraxella sp.]